MYIQYIYIIFIHIYIYIYTYVDTSKVMGPWGVVPNQHFSLRFSHDNHPVDPRLGAPSKSPASPWWLRWT